MADFQMGLLQLSKYQDILHYALQHKEFERLVVILKMRYAMRWKWTIPQYLHNAVGDKTKFTDAAERWLLVNDCGSFIRPYIKRAVYGLCGAESLKCKVCWQTVPMEIEYWAGLPVLNPHTAEVYKWLEENVYVEKGTLPNLNYSKLSKSHS